MREMIEQMTTVNNGLDTCIFRTPMATVKPYLRQPLTEYIRQSLGTIEDKLALLEDVNPEYRLELEMRGEAFREKLAELAILPAGEA